MGDSNQAGGHFIVPFKTLAQVFGALVVLTVLTVVFHEMHLGWLAAPVAFVIATAKAFLVMAHFMGLKYEAQTNRIIFASGFFFLLVLFFFCVLDIWSRVAEVSTL